MTRRFTGRHMTAILVAFFGVVVGVNALMATYAARTFGGTVVDNSYVASQEYNSWLRAARAQEKLGWHPVLGVDPSRRVTVALSVPGAVVTGHAEHPLGRQPDVALSFAGTGSRFRSTQALPAGRWTVHLLIRRGSDQARAQEILS